MIIGYLRENLLQQSIIFPRVIGFRWLEVACTMFSDGFGSNEVEAVAAKIVLTTKSIGIMSRNESRLNLMIVR